MKQKQIIKYYEKYSWLINVFFGLLLVSKLIHQHFKLNLYTISVFISLILYIIYSYLIRLVKNKKIKYHIYFAKIFIILFHLLTILANVHHLLYFIVYIIFLLITNISLFTYLNNQSKNDN